MVSSSLLPPQLLHSLTPFLLPSPGLNIWVQHPLLIRRHTAAMETLSRLRKTDAGPLIDGFPETRQPGGDYWRVFTLFSFPLSSQSCSSCSLARSHFLFAWCASDKRSASSLSTVFVPLTPSLLLAVQRSPRQEPEIGTSLKKKKKKKNNTAIKDIHLHRAIDNQALLSSLMVWGVGVVTVVHLSHCTRRRRWHAFF